MVFIFKQNFGLAILINIGMGIFFVREYRNKAGIFWFVTGYSIVIFCELAYLIVTQSLAPYISDFYMLTMVKIGQQGIFNSQLPWMYPGTVIQKLGKIILYLMPLIVALWSGRIAWRKDKKLLIFSGLVVSFYLFGIRPTTDYVHLAPLLAITPVVLMGGGKPQKLIYFGVGILAACGIYSSLNRQYYRWNVPLSQQNYFNNMPRVKLWMDAENRQTMKTINDYLMNRAKGDSDLFVYSFSPMYYFVSDKQNPTRYDYLHCGILTDGIEREIADDLERQQPKYVLADVDINADTTSIGSYIREKYNLEVIFGNLCPWRRQ